MRRFITFLVVAAATAGGTLWWLHDGDIREAIQPVLAEWHAEVLSQVARVGATEPNGLDETP